MIDHFKPWHTQPICVIDFETTGVDPQECAPVQVAAVRFDTAGRSRVYSSRINPGVPIPESASAIHGITDADVVDAPRFGDQLSMAPVVAGIVGLMVDAIPAAYNAPYDRTILGRMCEGPTLPWLDPLIMVWAKDRYETGKGRHRLEVVCKRWGVLMEGAHDAVADAAATGRLLLSDPMRKLLGDMTYSEVIRRQQIRAAEREADFASWKARQPAEGAANV